MNQTDLFILLFNGEVEAAKDLFEKRFWQYMQESFSREWKDFLYATNSGIYYYILFQENVSLDECCSKNFDRIHTAGLNTDNLLNVGQGMIHSYGYSAEYLIKRVKNPCVRHAVLYIHQNLSKVISLEILAREVGLSRNQLCSSFRTETGDTVGSYIRKRRIKVAKELLKDTDMEMQMIAEYCGFQSLSYFCTIFKKESGCTPLQFRKSN
jgi:AraC-like DNA-binding protein